MSYMSALWRREDHSGELSERCLSWHMVYVMDSLVRRLGSIITLAFQYFHVTTRDRYSIHDHLILIFPNRPQNKGRGPLTQQTHGHPAAQTTRTLPAPRGGSTQSVGP